jgi:hypothetical protein
MAEGAVAGVVKGPAKRAGIGRGDGSGESPHGPSQAPQLVDIPPFPEAPARKGEGAIRRHGPGREFGG